MILFSRYVHGKMFNAKAPWWSWHQLERFWVDANFLHGHFPPALVEAWPRLRSLDLQLNELSGDRRWAQMATLGQPQQTPRGNTFGATLGF